MSIFNIEVQLEICVYFFPNLVKYRVYQATKFNQSASN